MLIGGVDKWENVVRVGGRVKGGRRQENGKLRRKIEELTKVRQKKRKPMNELSMRLLTKLNLFFSNILMKWNFSCQKNENEKENMKWKIRWKEATKQRYERGQVKIEEKKS